MSISDGWWAEGYNGANGWVIGDNQEWNDQGSDDWEDSQSLYQLLEEEVVPTYFHRNENDLPDKWLKIIKESIRSAGPAFSTARMVKDYTNQMYLPAMGNNKPGAG